MVEKRSLVAGSLAFVAGIPLILTGEQGPTGTYRLIVQKLALFIRDQVILDIARVVGLILTLVSSLGGSLS